LASRVAGKLRKGGQLKPDQWFTLWITLLQVIAGGVATLAAVWIGAAFALRGQRRSADEQRSRLAAERCLRAIDEALMHIDTVRIRLGVEIKYAMDSSPDRLEGLGSDVNERIVAIHDTLIDSDIGHEAWLLEDRAAAAAIADCIEGLVELHTKGFGLSLEDLRLRADGLYRRFGSTGDQLRAILLGKDVNQLTLRDREITTALLHPSHEQFRRLSDRVEKQEPRLSNKKATTPPISPWLKARSRVAELANELRGRLRLPWVHPDEGGRRRRPPAGRS
jgi:hypothetical protein